MKTIKSVNVGSFALYGAVLAALWTFVFGLYYWLLGWIFGAQSWFIDMNLGNWTVYTNDHLRPHLSAGFHRSLWRRAGWRGNCLCL